MRTYILIWGLSFLALPAFAQEEAVEGSGEAGSPAPPAFMVVLPEQVDGEWFWFFHANTSHHIVQSRIEKVLVRKGLTVLDSSEAQSFNGYSSINSILVPGEAIRVAKEAGATYLVLGQATAVKSSQGNAYGVNVVRSQATITAKVIQVEDGKVLDVFEAEATGGGQATRGAGQDALKIAAKDVSGEIGHFCASLVE